MFQDDSIFYLVQECYKGGDLTTIKERALQQGVSIKEDWWRFTFHQVLDGMMFMHGQAMIHCDIKEPNIMVKTADFQWPEIVIIDLGVATCMARDGVLHGTPGYVPPETLQTKMWFPVGDMFSFGVVIMQLLLNRVPSSRVPFAGIFQEGCRDARQVFQETLRRVPPFDAMPAEMPQLTQLVRRLLAKNRKERPNAVTAQSDDWFAMDNSKTGAGVGVSPTVKMAKVMGKLQPMHDLATQGITDDMIRNLRYDSIGTMPLTHAMSCTSQDIRDSGDSRTRDACFSEDMVEDDFGRNETGGWRKNIPPVFAEDR
jgi:serine/threonine protein kinase